MLSRRITMILKCMLYISGISGFICGSIHLHVAYKYMISLPRIPQPQTGHIHPWNIHGAIVYMNENQYYTYYSLQAIFVSCALGVGIFGGLLNFLRNRRK